MREYTGRDSLYGAIRRRLNFLHCGSTSVILPAPWLDREAHRLGLPYGSKVKAVEIREHLDGSLTIRALKELKEGEGQGGK
jgi:hypothetical protein